MAKLSRLPYFLLGFNPKSIFVLEDEQKKLQCPIFNNIKALQKFNAKHSDLLLQQLMLNDFQEITSVLTSLKILRSNLTYITINPDPEADKVLCYTFDEFLDKISKLDSSKAKKS